VSVKPPSRVVLFDGEVDLQRGLLERGGETFRLTTREVSLLAYLAARSGQMVSFDELLIEVWEFSPAVVSRAAYHTARRLRQKIEEDPSKPRHLLTVHGEGLRFEPWEEAAPAAPASTTPTVEPVSSLPAQLTRFIGREALLDELASRLTSERLVTLVGPGGVGKTRLALAAGGRLQAAGALPGGAWFCDLTTRQGRAGLHEALVTTLGLRQVDDDPSVRLIRLADALAAHGACLLILDNFEQLAAWSSDLLPLLQRAPELRLLVTSRVRLKLTGASALELPPMDPEEGAALFLERADGAGGASWARPGPASPPDRRRCGAPSTGPGSCSPPGSRRRWSA